MLANAPCSFGYHGVTRPGIPLPDGDLILRAVSDSGYRGIDLGPHGLFGKGTELIDNLNAHNLLLAGGWIDYPFAQDEDSFRAAVDNSREVLAEFVNVRDVMGGPAPLPTIADSGDAARRRSVGGGVGLDGEQWATFCRRVNEVDKLVREEYGLEPTFHHHTQTYIETPEEVQRFLEGTNMDITFDTGHLLVGGGSPSRDFVAWQDRINHVHLKDVDTRKLAEPIEGDDAPKILWESRVFAPLGQGTLDLDDLVRVMAEANYSGWIVIEQDVVIINDGDVDRAIEEQDHNFKVAKEMFS